MAKHNETGAKGEIIAADYLRAKGYQILATNWRAVHKEIDVLAALAEDELIVIEVKTRAGFGFGFPEESVTPAKQGQLRAAAEVYIGLHPQYTRVRFDVISIILNGGELKELLHLEDAF